MDNFGKTVYPKEYSALEKKRQAVLSRPLAPEEINILLSMRFNGLPLFESIDFFYTEEYKSAFQSGKSSSERESIQKYRVATTRESNLLYSDLHSKSDKASYSVQSTPSE